MQDQNVYTVPLENLSPGCIYFPSNCAQNFWPRVFPGDRFHAFCCRTNEAGFVPDIANKFLYNIFSTREQLRTRCGKNVLMPGMPGYLYSTCPQTSVYMIAREEEPNTSVSLLDVYVRFVTVAGRVAATGEEEQLKKYYLVVLVRTPEPVNLRHAVRDNTLQTACPGQHNPQDVQYRMMAWLDLYSFMLSFPRAGLPGNTVDASSLFLNKGKTGFSSVFSVASIMHKIQVDVCAQHPEYGDARSIRVVGWGSVPPCSLAAMLDQICAYEHVWDDCCAEYEKLKKKGEVSDFSPSALPDIRESMPAVFQGGEPGEDKRLPCSLVNIVATGLRGERMSKQIDQYTLELPPAAYTAMIADSLDIPLHEILGVFADSDDAMEDRTGAQMNATLDDVVQGQGLESDSPFLVGREGKGLFEKLSKFVVSADSGSTGARLSRYTDILKFAVLQAQTNINTLSGYGFQELHDCMRFLTMHDAKFSTRRDFFVSGTTKAFFEASEEVAEMADVEDADFLATRAVAPMQSSLLMDSLVFSRINAKYFQLYPENVHLLHVLCKKQYIGMFDFADNAFHGIRGGLGAAVIVTNGGHAYRQYDASRSSVPVFNKRNGAGADVTMMKYKTLMDFTTYFKNEMRPPLQFYIESLQTTSRFGMKMHVCDKYVNGKKENVLKSKRQRHPRFSATEIQLADNEDGVAFMMSIVEMVARESNNKTAQSSRSTVQDDRGKLKQRVETISVLRVQPVFELFACNRVPLKCHERMYTLSNVILVMPASIKPGAPSASRLGEFTGAFAGAGARGVFEGGDLGLLENIHFVTHCSAMFLAFIQRYGVLGCSTLSPATFAVWHTFTTQWRMCAGLCTPHRVCAGQDSRCEQMVESRAVCVSLCATVLTANRVLAWVKGDGERTYIDHFVMAGRMFANSSVDPACLPYMVAALVDQTIAVDFLVVLQLMCGALRAPVLERSSVMEWFRTGAIANQETRGRLARWVSAMLGENCALVSPLAPHQLLLSPSPAAHAESAAGVNVDYACSIFQVSARVGGERKTLLQCIAQRVFKQYERHLIDHANMMHESVLDIALGDFADKAMLFPTVYGDLPAFVGTRALLDSLPLQRVASDGDYPRPLPPCAKLHEYRHSALQLVPPSETRRCWTLAVDIRWVVWAAAVTGGPSAGAFPPQRVSQHAKYLVTEDITKAFFRNFVPASMFGARLAALGIPDPRGGGLMLTGISAGARAAGGPVTTLVSPLPRLAMGNAAPRSCTESLRRMRMETDVQFYQTFLGFTLLSPTGRAEDAGAISAYYRLAVRLKLPSVLEIPTWYFAPEFTANRWFPAFDLDLQQIVACKIAVKRESDRAPGAETVLMKSVLRGGARAILELPVSTEESRFRTMLPLFPLFDIARQGVLVYFAAAGPAGDAHVLDPEILRVPQDENAIVKPTAFEPDRVLSQTQDEGVYGVLLVTENAFYAEYFSPDLLYSVSCRDGELRRISFCQLLHSLVPYGSDILIDTNSSSFVHALQENVSWVLPDRLFNISDPPSAREIVVATLHWDDHTAPGAHSARLPFVFAKLSRKTVHTSGGDEHKIAWSAPGPRGALLARVCAAF